MVEISTLKVGDILYDECDERKQKYCVKRIYENFAVDLEVDGKVNKYYSGVLSSFVNEQKFIANVLAEQKKIKEFLTERGIKYLVHFTDEANVESIKKHGLLSRDELNARNITYYANDQNRYDNYFDAISLSITRPNTFLLDVFVQKGLKPIFIKIDASILYQEINTNRIYCIANAAATDVKRQSGNSFAYLQKMFADKIEYSASMDQRPMERGEGYKPNITTDVQAEILFCGPIAPKFILGYETEYNWGNE